MASEQSGLLRLAAAGEVSSGGRLSPPPREMLHREMLPLLPREVQPGGPRVSDVRAGLSPCLGWLLQGPGLGFAVPLSPWDRLKQASSWGRPLNQAGTWPGSGRAGPAGVGGSRGGAGRGGVRQGGAGTCA